MNCSESDEELVYGTQAYPTQPQPPYASSQNTHSQHCLEQVASWPDARGLTGALGPSCSYSTDPYTFKDEVHKTIR